MNGSFIFLNEDIEMNMSIDEVNVTESIWNYFLVLEKDLEATTRYVEPQDQDSVFSIEFFKIIVLAATECEAAMKVLCKSICGEEKGNIGEYKGVILDKYPGIVDAEVYIPRANKRIKPFENWNKGNLDWWVVYGLTKHNHINYFSSANFFTALKVLSALYILVFYLRKERIESFSERDSIYIYSDYTSKTLITEGGNKLP